jgi:hypothetical protein
MKRKPVILLQFIAGGVDPTRMFPARYKRGHDVVKKCAKIAGFQVG